MELQNNIIRFIELEQIRSIIIIALTLNYFGTLLLVLS